MKHIINEKNHRSWTKNFWGSLHLLKVGFINDVGLIFELTLTIITKLP